VHLCRDGVTLNFDLLTQKRNQVICVPRCTSEKSLAKIRQQILEISRKHKTTTWIMDGRTDGRTHARTDSGTDGRPENIQPPPAPTGGGKVKSPNAGELKYKTAWGCRPQWGTGTCPCQISECGDRWAFRPQPAPYLASTCHHSVLDQSSSWSCYGLVFTPRALRS